MGVSIDAILCYGFRIRDEDGYEEGTPRWLQKAADGDDSNDEDGAEELGFDDFLANLVGLEEPDSVFNKERFDSDPDYQQLWKDYWAKKRRLEDQFGVALVCHCSDEEMMYILAAKGSVWTASWGEPIELGQSVNVPPEWREKIRLFCERADIKFEEPQLILCSYRG